MFYSAKPAIFRNAESLRNNMTKAELLLWERLKQNKLNGYRFKAQHPVSQFIVDFYCHKAKLVIELDGPIHELPEKKEYDAGRSYELKQLGITEVRFINEHVFNDIENVLSKIAKYLPK
ncbi:MAG: endonuclease domain-containing protein [Bacteroidetes bacterium]|nr:endonuclease domain-containing protein [Bacteroidota bacterium]